MPPIEIKNKNFNQLLAENNQRVDAIKRQSVEERWSNERLGDVSARAQLPFFTAITDPANIELVAAFRSLVLNNLTPEGIDWRIPDPKEISAIQQWVSEFTKKMNEINNTNYPDPAIIFRRMPSTPAAFAQQGDIVFIDPAQLSDFKEDPAILQGIIAHEIGHRYIRDDESLLHGLRAQIATQSGEVKNDDMITNARIVEARADYAAAQLTSPEKVKNFITKLTEDGNPALSEYIRDSLNMPNSLPANTVVKTFNDLPEAQRNTLAQQFDLLPDEKMQELFDRGVLFEDRNDARAIHPSTTDRLELQAALAAHPQLLNPSLKLEFNREADIVRVLGASPSQTLNLATINRQADEAVGLRPRQ